MRNGRKCVTGFVGGYSESVNTAAVREAGAGGQDKINQNAPIRQR